MEKTILFRQVVGKLDIPILSYASTKKWFDVSSNIKPEGLVLAVDESTKRGHWPEVIQKFNQMRTVLLDEYEFELLAC